MFATFSTKADRLTVLKTSFPEELLLTGKAPPSTPKVISLVAFRWVGSAVGSCSLYLLQLLSMMSAVHAVSCSHHGWASTLCMPGSLTGCPHTTGMQWACWNGCMSQCKP